MVYPDEKKCINHDCFLPNIPIELILNRYSGSLHKLLKLDKFEFFE